MVVEVPLFPAFPSQAVFYGLCLVAICLLAFRGKGPDRAISFILGTMWAAMALSFSVEVFRMEHLVTWVGLLLLLAQTLIFLWEGILRKDGNDRNGRRGRLDFQARAGGAPVVGALFLLYSLVLQPVLELVLEPDPFPLPYLGLPFNAVLFTFGLLLFLREGFPRHVLYVPLIWAALGGLAAFREVEPREWGLLAALLAGAFLALPGRQKLKDVEGNERMETWYEHAARHQRRCGLSTLGLVLATCFLGFVVAAGKSPFYLPARQLEGSTTVLAALALGLWLALPAWYNAGFRLLAWEATRGLRVVRGAWDWVTARWVGVIALSVLTLWVMLTIYKASGTASWIEDLSSSNLIVAALAVLLFYAVYRARRRIVITEFVDYTKNPELEGCGKGLGSRLRNELANIKTLYQTIDEAMPPRNGQVVRVTVGVEDVLKPLEDVIGPDAVAEVGSWKISFGFFLRLVGWMVRGPRITGSLHQEGNNLLLVADLAGGGLSGTWRVSSVEEPPSDEPRPRTATVYWLAEQLAYRIITSLGNVGSPRWEAVRCFTHGLRAYRTTQMTKGDAAPELRQAEREFINALSVDRTFSQCHYNLGVVYQAMKAYDSAEAAYRHILEQNPNWSEAYYALATVYFDSGQEEKAGIFARKMIEVRPDDARAWNLNGTARYAYGHADARRQGHLHQPYAGKSWQEIVLSFEIAAAVAWRDLCSAALRSSSSALAWERQLAVKCATNLGIVRSLERDAEGAENILEQAFRLAPHDARAHMIRGETLFDEKRMGESRTELFRTFGDAPDVDDQVERWIYLLGVHLALADSAKRKHAFDTILDHMVPPEEMVLASGSDEVAERDRKREYAAHLDHFETMLKVLEEKMGPGTGNFDSLLRRVDFIRWLELGTGTRPSSLVPGEKRWTKAQELILDARRALPKDPARAHRALKIAIRLLKTDHSRQIARQGLRSLEARAGLERVRRTGGPDLLMKAVEHAESSVAQEPGSALRRWVLGDVYAELGDFKEASNERETALNLGIEREILDDPRVLGRIAQDYLRLAGVPEQPAPKARLERGLRFFERILQFVESRKSHRSEAQFAAHAAAHFWVGRFYCELEKYEKGIDHLQVARSMMFRPIEIGLRLGNFYSWNRSYREAELAFGESLKAVKRRVSGNGALLADETPEELEAELLLSGAMLLAERGVRLELAELLCNRAAERLRSLRGARRQELRTLYQECRGWVLFRSRDFESSLKVLKAAAHATGSARVYTRLAQVYEAIGSREALRHAREAREQAKAGRGVANARVQGVFDLWVEPPPPAA
ncbi:MAG: hypothetical protein QOH06_2059 [Acidobacteriota bacterium]|jgi:tetratricopeptide (TPR) repeat protein|nr:hypothetical protein [Acidobacteriota bacterium]